MKKKSQHQPLELLEDFKVFVKASGGVRATSRMFGLSPAYISIMMTEQAPIAKQITVVLGWSCEEKWSK